MTPREQVVRALQGESGLPCLAYECMKRAGFVLDPTRDRVRRWLHDLFARYTRAGYRYFKLDFLWPTLKAPPVLP